MATEFGKVLRIIRINCGDSLRDMAGKIGVSPAYLSAIENGKRFIPETLYYTICQIYPLSEKDKKRLKESIEASVRKVKIDLTDLAEKKKQVLLKLTQEDLDEDTLDQLCEIINKKGDKN